MLLVVEEKVPGSEGTRIYGLILDYSTMQLSHCESMLEQSLLEPKGDCPQWSPREMKVVWGLIEEARRESTQGSSSQAIVPLKVASPSPKKRGKKRRSLVGAPRDKSDPDATAKKLTISLCVAMKEAEIKKLDPKHLKVMKSLYKTHFDCMYKWKKTPFVDAAGKTLRVHFDYLHRAPEGRIVYRGIEETTRLPGMMNKARLKTDYDVDWRIITVLPVKMGPYGADKKATYFDTCPKADEITATTNYFIIGGQHTVEAYKRLVAAKEIPEADVQEASCFKIIPIFAPRSKFTDVMHLSRALNQNVAGEQKEQSFLKQLATARIKWREMGSPQPAFGGRAHTAAYNVTLFMLTPMCSLL